MQQDPAVWRQFREQVPLTRNWAYLDNAAVAPLSVPARNAVLGWLEQATEQGDTAWPSWARQLEEVRSLAASLVNADRDEIAFVSNTTSGINLVAEGFPWQNGDNVVVLGNEFPSNLYPWMNLSSRGVETRRIPVDGIRPDPERILAACDERTRLLSLSWVGYATGWRIDVPPIVEAAHARGILVFLDAIQGLGVFPIDVRDWGVDFFAADGHKWLMGPEGAGLFFIRREHLERLRPLSLGWNSVVHAHDFARIELTLKSAAARYEGGSQNMCGILALGASLRMLAGFGLRYNASPLAARVRTITDYACERLFQSGAKLISGREEPHWSGIVAFDFPGRNMPAERQRCLDAGVVLSYRGGCLRISPHAYADCADIDRLIQVLSRSPQ